MFFPFSFFKKPVFGPSFVRLWRTSAGRQVPRFFGSFSTCSEFIEESEKVASELGGDWTSRRYVGTISNE
ncbi:hypothetical protein A3J44_02190 [candidate division WOR-1 bacterium RIFCSPHIGHO2_02_FULL_45_12]|uniref:Uncharacterized protein n=1 Tax=candidate division WOR-1 bacterium RIFCSPLOWO2_12_FULL_45_9 TaxID=1802568 RepID=A0A1F4RIC4_UNCSA|nr:MAG: hypothetical protein A3J44_02190 [candidate division WOR-1 bacterium RIFCSPHIGHO2_02_FULL_45_12]OGC07909.1 MAG: hypothetical protein A3F86_03200 [candidate division WOR-1 bacterium RIFCSPLOWO2_12_FULL_45_9]